MLNQNHIIRKNLRPTTPVSFMCRITLLGITLLSAVQAAALNSSHTITTALPNNSKPVFTCIHEKDHFPPIDPKVDTLYRYAHYLEKRNLIKQDPAVFLMIERLYQIAAAHNDYRANRALYQILAEKKPYSKDRATEARNLAERLIQQNLAGGYYDMATHINRGLGLMAEIRLTLQYYRKSANLGSPEGQYEVSHQLSDLGSEYAAFDMAQPMLRCAADQGHKEAASEYAVQMKRDNKPAEALLYYQQAIKNGDAISAFYLADAVFPYTLPPNNPDYIGVTADQERARRYQSVFQTLSDYYKHNPTVPELDEIVPLPPAPLPPWDGKIQWLKDWEANIPPPKPSEALITELARAKQLDPKTGRPAKTPSP